MDFDSASTIGTDLIYRWDDAERGARLANDKPATTPLSASTSSQPQANLEDSLQEQQEDEGDSESDDEEEELDDWLKRKPWHKRPSELWLRPCAFILAMTVSRSIEVGVILEGEKGRWSDQKLRLREEKNLGGSFLISLQTLILALSPFLAPRSGWNGNGSKSRTLPSVGL